MMRLVVRARSIRAARGRAARGGSRRTAPTLLVLAALAIAPPSAVAAGLTLEEALRLAAARDERGAIAEQEVAAADADLARARAFFFPDVTLAADYRFRSDPGDFQDRNLVTAELSARLTLFDGRGIPLYRASARARDASRHDRADTARAVAFDTSAAFLATLGTQAVLEAAEHRVEWARANLADARGRASAALASSNDATRAELELASAARELERARGQLAAARLALGLLIGAPVDRPLASPEALLTGAAAEPPAAERPDLAALRARAAAADHLAAEPLWRWLPSFSLIGAASRSSVGDVTGKSTDYFVGLSALWALWDGGERTADRDARVAQATIADLTLARAAREAALEVATARSALDAARAAAASAESATAAARKNVEQTRTLYRQGLARALEVADATAQLFDAEVALARERVALGVAVLDLRRALGGWPLEPPGARRGGVR